MKEAGRTVGGFYKHFDSHDDLVAEALSDAFGVWQLQKEDAEFVGQPLTFVKLIDDYLSDVHRKNTGTGCAFSALAHSGCVSHRASGSYPRWFSSRQNRSGACDRRIGRQCGDAAGADARVGAGRKPQRPWRNRARAELQDGPYPVTEARRRTLDFTNEGISLYSGFELLRWLHGVHRNIRWSDRL